MKFTKYDIELFLIDLKLQRFGNVIGMLETTLAREEKESTEYYDKILSEMSSDLRDQYDTYVTDKLHDIVFEIPRLLFSNVVVSIWSVLEHSMVSLTQERVLMVVEDPVEKRKRANRVREMGSVQQYWIDQSVAFTPGWAELDEIREVRNLIVHNDSQLHVAQDVELKQHERSKRVAAYVASRLRDNKVGLSFDGNDLVVTGEFCNELVNLCREFLGEMYERTTDPKAAEFLANIFDLTQ